MPVTDNIGFVAIGRNEGPRLEACLVSLARAGAKRVVYVDSGSTDDCVAKAQAHGAVVVNLDMSIPFSAARARNAGFARVMAGENAPEFIQFIDADCILSETWLEAATAFLDGHPDVTAVCGRRRERFPDRSLYNTLCDQEWNTPVGEAGAFGGDVLIRSRPLQESGGYRDELICGEEPELCIRLREKGGRIWRLDAEMTLHDANMLHFSQWWRRAVRGGYGTAKVALLHYHSPFAIWKREILRIVFYAAAVPALALAGALVHPMALALLLYYPLQVIRIAVRKGAMRRESWIYAFFMVIGKFAEFQGVLKYGLDLLMGRRSKLIEYKGQAESFDHVRNGSPDANAGG